MSEEELPNLESMKSSENSDSRQKEMEELEELRNKTAVMEAMQAYKDRAYFNMMQVSTLQTISNHLDNLHKDLEKTNKSLHYLSQISYKIVEIMAKKEGFKVEN